MLKARSQRKYKSYAERRHRHVFHVLQDGAQHVSPVFYLYIRLTGYEDSMSCLHGVGLELFGEVHEEKFAKSCLSIQDTALQSRCTDGLTKSRRASSQLELLR